MYFERNLTTLAINDFPCGARVVVTETERRGENDSCIGDEVKVDSAIDSAHDSFISSVRVTCRQVTHFLSE